MKTLNFSKAVVLSELVKEYSIDTPNKIAINDGFKQLSYKDLSELSNSIAADLLTKGIKKGDRVCVIAKKCSEIIPFAIGIWKAGGIYSPLDLELPQDRLQKIIANISPFALIRENDMNNSYDDLGISVHYSFEDCYKILANQYDVKLPLVAPDDNAIIIHTSGTTGLPKAVVLQHKSVVAYFNSHRFILNTTNESRCLNTASFHYDVSIQDTFQPLYFGAYVYLYRNFFIPEIALPLIQEEKFTLITAVSTILSLITGDLENLDLYKFPDLKYISTGAEVCSVKLFNKWVENNPGLIVSNGYGPSEVNSVTVSHHITIPDENRNSYYPIGKPHKDVKAVLVNDEDHIITNVDTDGELYLGGPQLMSHYWGNEKATAKAFAIIKGEKYYKTGDVCFYDENYDLVYNGRKDFEVKHNGRRINLSEITATVLENFDLKAADCHQIKIDDLTSYLNLVLRVEDYSSVGELRKDIYTFLKQKFPLHSVPSVYSFYDKPLQTSSGKVNRKLLFDLSTSAVQEGFSEVYSYNNEKFEPF